MAGRTSVRAISQRGASPGRTRHVMFHGHHATRVRHVSSKSQVIGAYAGRSDHQLKADVAKRLLEAGEIITEYVRGVAAQFSTRIPMATHTRGGISGVYVITYGAQAPNAYPFEDGVFHPLFATGPRKTWGKWYKQPLRPYMEQGAALGVDKAANQFANIIDDWAHELGFD